MFVVINNSKACIIFLINPDMLKVDLDRGKVTVVPSSPGQRDLLLLRVPAGGHHLPELQQQLPVAPGNAVRYGGSGGAIPVPHLERRRPAALHPAGPGAPETGAADQQQPAPSHPPHVSPAEIRGVHW